MMYAEFDLSLVTGNEVIDGQHKELIDRINKLAQASQVNGGKVQAIQMLDYLAEYTDFHFGDEEKLQKEVSYPGLEEHKKKHEEFRQAIKDLYEMLREEEGPTEAFVNAVQKNVIDWLYSHIKGFDSSVAAFVNIHQHPERL